MSPIQSRRFFTAQQKAEILYYWRKSRHRVITDGITEREVWQWAALEHLYGIEGLKFQEGVPLQCLRAAPAPIFPLVTTFTPSGAVMEVRDVLGFPITEPQGIIPRMRLFYLAVKVLTDSTGICTIPDLAHILWPASMQVLPSKRILDTLTCVFNAKSGGDRIRTVVGRGYRFLPA